MRTYTVLLFLLCSVKSFSQTTSPNFSEPPAWSKEVIWYQIFVERFHNGDFTNDPKPEDVAISPMNVYAPTGWSVTPWTSDWFEQESWSKATGKPLKEMMHHRRYGGDLQGVLNKLDYLQELGITALFINPINNAPSLHKYDAATYHHVDVTFGPDPEGDKKIIASENPNDPSTWKWTAADKIFLKLIDEVHKRGMKIILDYSWNHTGTTFWAWQDILKNQEKSIYKDWYTIKSFDNPATPQNEFDYDGWLNVKSLPELKKVDIKTPKRNGRPYEGDIFSEAKNHIMAVTKRWLSPDGDITKGIDGFRLDVADQVGLAFWRDFRKTVRAIQPNAYLVGEIWWEEWPDKLMNPVPYTSGDIFDAVMFYQTYKPARYFFAKTDLQLDAKQFRDSLLFQWNRLNKSNRYAMMNVAASHDAPRLLSDFYNSNKYKYQASPNDNPAYKTGKPDEETYKRLRLYLVHTFTSIGAPHIWNGDEMGMWGADDPHPRKPLMWKEFEFKPERRNNFQPNSSDEKDSVKFNQAHFDFYKKLISLRKNNQVLVTGEIEFMQTEGKTLAYKRYAGNEEIFVLFNASSKSQKYNFLRTGKYKDLLTNQVVDTKKLSVNSLSAMILKRIN
jgi:glycosidase